MWSGLYGSSFKLHLHPRPQNRCNEVYLKFICGEFWDWRLKSGVLVPHMHTAAVIESFWLRFVCWGYSMSHQNDMPPLPSPSDSPDSWPTVTFLQVAEDVTTWPNRPFCHSLMYSAVSFLAQWLWNTVVVIANVTATYILCYSPGK